MVESENVRILPKRHKRRCLSFGTPRLVEALEGAGAAVRREVPGSPALMVGNIGRARGGPIHAYSKSHQAGRDADLAFYRSDGRAPDDLDVQDLATFEVRRNRALVRALLNDPSIDVEWLFISEPLKQALLAGGDLPARARRVLHQPSNAPPHDDHLHLRIRCSQMERRGSRCAD